MFRCGSMCGMIEETRREVETMPNSEHRPSTFQERMEKADQGIVDDSPVADGSLDTEWEPRAEPPPEEPAAERDQVPA